MFEQWLYAVSERYATRENIECTLSYILHLTIYTLEALTFSSYRSDIKEIT